ncbi:GntR family transcriptional regulator, arabinose operon transcriptional repressor [Ruminococcaceae bacterium YRB3002]|nr:GntR family transcriptional regulator, arabinose operon transcriptional repressor [Ruminococcaceae bacterium YRB3002]
MSFKYTDIVDKLEVELMKMRQDGSVRLPSEKELCARFDCSRQTVRSALTVLESRGLIVRRKGSGSYLADTGFLRNSTVVFITEDEDRYIYPVLISQLRYLLQKNKYSLKCLGTSGTIRGEREQLVRALEEKPAAVIIDPLRNVIPNPNLGLIEEIAASGVPVVYLFTSYPVPVPEDAVIVSEDNEEGAQVLVRYLAEKGHRKIAGVWRGDDSRGLQRLSGFMKACTDLDLPCDESDYFLFSDREQHELTWEGRSFIPRFIDECLGDHDAVICQNDIIAHRLIVELGNRGISVPGDVAVVSFDDSYYATLGNDRITSLGHGEHAVSSALAETVVAVAERRLVKTEPLKWVLHIRNSG